MTSGEWRATNIEMDVILLTSDRALNSSSDRLHFGGLKTEPPKERKDATWCERSLNANGSRSCITDGSGSLGEKPSTRESKQGEE